MALEVLREIEKAWSRFALERYEKLKRWREYALLIARACRGILGDRCLRVYVLGGTARGLLIVLSDIDVVIVVGEERDKGIDVRLKVKRRAEELGLPWDVSVDLSFTL
jgi:predicted nucleotidyltransferase